MIEIRVDAADALGFFDRLHKQAPFAMATAINRVAEEGLAAIRKEMTGHFILRTPFALPPVQLPNAWKATKNKLWAVVDLGDDSRVGQRRKQLLGRFESGGAQPTATSRYPYAIPTGFLRSSPRDLIAKKLFPRNLVGTFDTKGNLTGWGRKARVSRGRGKGHGKSVGRYFVLGSLGSTDFGIYERFGPMKGEIRPLWMFRDRINLPRDLHFQETGQRIVAERFEANLLGAWDFAQATAR